MDIHTLSSCLKLFTYICHCH